MKWSAQAMTFIEDARAKPENRRSSYRIDDEIMLLYEEIQSDRDRCADFSPAHDATTAVLLCARLAEYHHQVHRLLREVQKEALGVFKCLKALDEEIDMIAHVLLSRELAPIASTKRQVKLSATGVAFPTERQLDENRLLVLQMVLLPSFAGIISEAQVVRSTPFLGDAGRQFMTTVEFVNMRDATRDIIARHILDRQKELARRARDPLGRDAPPA
jgi:hypothetical protein